MERVKGGGRERVKGEGGGKGNEGERIKGRGREG